MGNHNYKDLDDLIHGRVRLATISFLYTAGETSFSELKDVLVSVSDGNLSANLKKLEEASYISVAKAFVNKKPKTTLALTAKGRKAFENYLKHLKELLPDMNDPKKASMAPKFA